MSVNQEASRTAEADGRAPIRMATLSVPADKNYLALVRTAAMHVAILLPLPVDKVTDLRLAVDEACTALLGDPRAAGPVPDPDPARELELSFDRFPGRLEVVVRGPVHGGLPEQDEIGWTMLEALVGEVRVQSGDGTAELTLVVPLPLDG